MPFAVDGLQGALLGLRNSASQKTLCKRKLAESLRLATVDNFPGEEAKIIVVSLVRANKEKNIGFLRDREPHQRPGEPSPAWHVPDRLLRDLPQCSNVESDLRAAG